MSRQVRTQMPQTQKKDKKSKSKGKKFDKFFALAIFFPCAPDDVLCMIGVFNPKLKEVTFIALE